MDPVKILKRAWHILWNYKTLWVFGFILALTAAGSSGGNSNNGTRYQGDGSDFPGYQSDMPKTPKEFFQEAGKIFEQTLENGIPSANITGEEMTTLVWSVVAFIIFMILISIVMTFAHYVSQTALIRMVDEYEANDSKMTIKEGFKIGWSRTSWRLFLINLIVNIPTLILMALLVVDGVVVYRMAINSGDFFATTSFIALIGITFLVIFITILVMAVLLLVRKFVWRVCVLEDLGVTESFQRGFAMARKNWKNVGIMWLVMLGLGVAMAIVSFISLFLLIPVAFFTAIFGAVIAGIPGLLMVGFFSIFMNGYLPWIVGALFIAPLFFTLAFSPWILLSAWQLTFTSTVWTLVYREFKALETLDEPVMEIEPTIE
ncbi:MAG: hypothetical protein GY755_25500 [Chloroflexi bacterium]|nr:hypothetical protein [Chloroflexota bacterium]